MKTTFYIILLAVMNAFAAYRMCAEWEPAIGTLIKWQLGIPIELVYELAKDDKLYVLLQNEVEQNDATYVFNFYNVNMDNVEFIFAPTNSHWTRDWGPVSLFDEAKMFIGDPIFDGYPWVSGGNKNLKGYEEDDLINTYVSEYLNIDYMHIPAYFTGGNTLTDGNGTIFFTEQMIDENLQIMGEDQFFKILEDSLGLSTIHVLPNPEIYGIQHIDCWVKMIDEETVLIKELPSWHPEYDSYINILNFFNSIQTCYGRDFNIYSIFSGSYNGNETAAYTNSLTLNKKVYVPLFGIPEDEAAIETYQNVMPGYDIVGIYYNNWYYYDALHCRTREIIDPEMIQIIHRIPDKFASGEDDFYISCKVNNYSNFPLDLDNSTLYYRINSSDWIGVTLTERNHSLEAIIPSQANGSIIDYYFEISNLNGKIQTKPEVAPDNYYSFTVNDLGIEDNGILDVKLKAYPNPFNPDTEISFILEKKSSVKLVILNAQGQVIKTLLNGSMPKGNHFVKLQADNSFSSGVYFCQIEIESKIGVEKILLLK
ncbi:MAG: agmatine deiminase family protein [Candidatus Delongbacteria bacterium]|nr:agmatine deiminase family protein [Candidatus Delongbacteria bacterium]MBN2834144.1 agmatine deiminase family protein [Candidatus Delongbacteria bacterium]